jgi:tetratricopeptide (TPR) repeat protein
MTSLNPRQLFLQLSYFLNMFSDYDLSRSVHGLSLFIESVALFMWTGISFRVSKKMIDYAKRAGVENHPSSFIDYRYIKKMHEFHVGNFEDDRDFGHVYQTGMHIGDFWPTTIYTLYSGLVCVELGKYERAMELIKKLEEISESFDNSHARAQAYRLSSMVHYRFRMMDQALDIADEGIRFTGKTGHFAMLLGIWCAKSLAHSAKNEIEEAKKALSEAEKLVMDRKIITVYHVPYLQARIHLELSELRSAASRQKPDRELFRTAIITANKLTRQSGKMQSAAVEAYRMKALIYRLQKKPHKAYKYFALSIQAGLKNNGVLELARTYFEVGKCLRERGSVRSSLLGISGSEYLLKAKTLFEEMDLHYDLRQYEEYMEG